ncbi:ABC transporter substrate-binding protein [Aristaeella lactis]|uniref:Raffinose/stachyose/melibiose transport system substrate-binding protein n=1 Tax=Aristaeella lactis TaxID=3046383 RepID=A0AC61PQP9_9FIRM|nr:extracellular solute-binding protein [Aristaeella lactis]QUA52380.1 extracellular solute-binding protein [Aristaeella lactis]SMC92721.1 raffinose/stachyose/melibiose transport system substrate-binding protein [Aristaeella lactis]
MKKLIAIVLTLALMMTAVSALADIVIVQNKVEITSQMEEFAKLYEEKTGVPVKVITGGGSSDYNTVLKAEMQSGREPDIFVIEGPSSYELWKDKIADQTGAEWTQYTAAAYMVDGKAVGFPVAVEGYGLAYNKSILDKAGIDPATLTTYDAYAAAFEKLDSMKEELGLDMVVSMVAGTTTGMTWVTGLHNFNVYLTVGNERNDTTYIDQVLEGKVDDERFHQYCQYVALIFKYSDPDMLLNGTQDSQLAAFANGKAAFYHQGNWMDPSLVAMNPDFEIAYAPHAFLHEETDGILVNPPSWYVINENGNKDEALAYLNFLATSEEGADYMVNKAAMVPAFTNVTLAPSSPLSKSVMEWNAAGKTYDWQQYKLPDGFGMGTLGQIYELFASGAIDVDTFEIMMKDAIAGIAK